MVDEYGLGLMSGRGSWSGSEVAGLRSGSDDHQSVTVALSLGGLSSNQGSAQSPSAVGFARRYTCVCQSDDGKSARCQNPGSADTAQGIDAGRGPSLSVFQVPLSVEQPRSRFCTEEQGQYQDAGI